MQRSWTRLWKICLRLTSKMATKKKPIKKKERTLAEFRAWLEGVEELQGSNWHPDAEQWRLIRAAIDSIVDDEPEVVYVDSGPAPVHTPPPRDVPVRHDSAPIHREAPRPTRPAPEQLMVNSSLPPNVEISPAAKAALGGKLPAGMVPDASGKLKTPNIDTTNGDYNSGFE